MIGVTLCVQDSSDNIGNSVATYCESGIECGLCVPRGTSPKKIDMIHAHEVTCTVVRDSRDHCADTCCAKVEGEGIYYANYVDHVFNPMSC